jgi:hypothetical protein
MGYKKDYKTTRNKISNMVKPVFRKHDYKKYNKSIIEKYFVSEKKLSEWEKEFYSSIRKQEFGITDSQLKIIYSIHSKYNK